MTKSLSTISSICLMYLNNRSSSRDQMIVVCPQCCLPPSLPKLSAPTSPPPPLLLSPPQPWLPPLPMPWPPFLPLLLPLFGWMLYAPAAASVYAIISTTIASPLAAASATTAGIIVVASMARKWRWHMWQDFYLLLWSLVTIHVWDTKKIVTLRICCVCHKGCLGELFLLPPQNSTSK